MYLVPFPVVSEYLTLQFVVSLGGRPNKPWIDRFLTLGLAHVAMCCTQCACMRDRLINAIRREYTVKWEPRKLRGVCFVAPP